MIIKYTDITPEDSKRYNAIVKRMTDGETIAAEDVEFYGQYCAAVASYEIELMAKLKSIEDECNARIESCEKTEKTARTAYNKLVNAALKRYEDAKAGE